MGQRRHGRCIQWLHKPHTRLQLTQERRKRRGGPLRLTGLCLPPKALGPLVPLYLQVRIVPLRDLETIVGMLVTALDHVQFELKLPLGPSYRVLLQAARLRCARRPSRPLASWWT